MTETFGLGIGALYDAFSVHSKGVTYKIKIADEVLSLNEIIADQAPG